MQLKPIERQVVVVAGASSGIGRETALQFAKRGAKVVVSGRSESKLASLVDEIRSFAGEVVSVISDVAIFEQVNAIADKAIEAFGRLDTWVHVPATALFATFEQTTPEEFERIIDVNLMGQVYGAMAALPHLRREGPGGFNSYFLNRGKAFPAATKRLFCFQARNRGICRVAASRVAARTNSHQRDEYKTSRH